MTYSLLQHSLDQKISREDLEEASVWVPRVARADCPGILRDLFGILVSGLSKEDALAFRAALLGKGFTTEVVADHEVPTLHESYQVQRVGRQDGQLCLTNSMGRVTTRDTSELVFVAAGFIRRVRRVAENKLRLNFGSGQRQGMPMLESHREYHDEQETEFRVDFFFHTEPRRIHLVLTDDSAMFYEGEAMRMRDIDGLRAMARKLAGMVPPLRWNRFLTHMDVCPEYPSMHAYEEELRWHFYRLLRDA